MTGQRCWGCSVISLTVWSIVSLRQIIGSDSCWRHQRWLTLTSSPQEGVPACVCVICSAGGMTLRAAGGRPARIYLGVSISSSHTRMSRGDTRRHSLLHSLGWSLSHAVVSLICCSSALQESGEEVEALSCFSPKYGFYFFSLKVEPQVDEAL